MPTPHLSSVTLTSKTDQYSFYNVISLNVYDQTLGSIGIWNNHIPMLWTLTEATIYIKTLVETHTLQISEGVIDVYYKKIHIIATNITCP
jgi:F0F1-type ATP synthase epsilon subunit